MEDTVPTSMHPADYMMVMLQASLLENSAEKKRKILDTHVATYLRQFDAGSISQTTLINTLTRAVYDVLLEKGDQFSKDAVGLAGITDQNITGNCVLFNFALKLLLEQYSVITNYWGLVVLQDMFSRYVHHFATLVELSSGEFYILDPVYKAHTKHLPLSRVEIGEVMWVDTELGTHQAIMAYPFRRLVLSQQNFWTGVACYNKQKYDEADIGFRLAMSMLGEQQGMLQTVLSSSLADEMGRYGKVNPEYTFNVGLVRYKQGRIDEALTYFRFAESLLPDNPHYSFYCACTSEELGDIDVALRFYRRFVELAKLGVYGDVNVAQKIKTLELTVQSGRNVADTNTTEVRPESVRGIDDVFSTFAEIVVAHAPVRPVREVLSDTDLVEDLYFSKLDLVELYLDLKDIYQVETNKVEETYNVGEMFTSILEALVEQIKPSTMKEFIKRIRERTQGKKD